MADRSPISILQEITVKKKGTIPVYHIESIGTLLEPKYKCYVTTPEVSSSGEARNKKDAKTNAAENALTQLGYNSSKSTSSPLISPLKKMVIVETNEDMPDTYNSYSNYIGQLNELASKRQLPYPIYEEDLFPENGQFKVTCKFRDIQTVGLARNKKEAKRIAAFKMSEKLKDSNILNSRTISIRSNFKPPGPVEIDSNDDTIIKKFAELTYGTIKRACNDGFAIKPNPQIKKEQYSVADAIEEISKLGYKVCIKSIQSNPFVVSTQLVGKEFTQMGYGETVDEATKRALNDTLEILREGYSSIFSD